MTVLAVRSLSKSFGGVHAVNEASFDVGAGEFLAMIGPNGAGKSTCFNMINGQLAPDAGEILLDGENIAGLAPRAVWRRGVGRTFQLAATFSSMTVAENVQMALLSRERQLSRLFGPPARVRLRDEALALLDQVHMAAQADRPIGVLNTHFDHRGVRARLDASRQIAELLSAEPERNWIVLGDFNIAISDEPMQGLVGVGLRSVLPDDAHGTFHAFGGGIDGPRIDHVLVTAGWRVEEARIDTTRPGGIIPSDHWPVVAALTLAI